MTAAAPSGEMQEPLELVDELPKDAVEGNRDVGRLDLGPFEGGSLLCVVVDGPAVLDRLHDDGARLGHAHLQVRLEPGDRRRLYRDQGRPGERRRGHGIDQLLEPGRDRA